jgi:hypothetical protein
MKAYELKDRKVRYQKKGEDKVTNAFVNDFEVKDDKAVFHLTLVTGRKIKAVDGTFNMDLQNDSDAEFNARKAFYGLRYWRGVQAEMPTEAFEEMTKVMGRDIMEMAQTQFDNAKEELIKERIEKSKVHRQYYHEGKLHVFYDIVEGNNVDLFKTREEIEKLKEDFARGDIHNNYKPKELDNLQAFDENFNLVIDEWNF